MKTTTFFRLAGSVLFLSVFNVSSFAAPGPCQGPNKNDPGCNDPPPPPPPATVVNSATVDWQNQRITVRGENLDLASTFSLGGSVELIPADLAVTASEVNIPFNTVIADVVMTKGNYQLNIDGADLLSLFVKSQIIATTATGCPCEVSWSSELAGLPPAPECLEISGPGLLDNADIAGTVYSDPNDPAVYPQYPFGSSFIAADPLNSVCRLVQINGDGTSSELANFRINETQQEECATILRNNYCAITTPLP